VSGSPSWYLDPLVAEQKRRVHQQWLRSAAGDRPQDVVLKTDLFEEAYGADRIFDDLFLGACLAVGMDLNSQTVLAAHCRYACAFQAIACDVRRLALRSESVDIVVSTSTLDHFQARADIGQSLDEITRVLRPGGVLLLTLDNPWNPLYHVLRWMSRRGWMPFALGETASLESLQRMLKDRGFQIQNAAYLIHNPRGISTVLFLTLRKLLGKLGDLPIRTLLNGFALLGKLPSRAFTGCFVAVSAVKPYSIVAGLPAD
jgi:SAM-dependent methyltransferase